MIMDVVFLFIFLFYYKQCPNLYIGDSNDTDSKAED